MTSTAARFDLQRHFIGGAFRESVAGGTFETVDPATNRPIVDVAAAQAEDVDRAVAAFSSFRG